MHYRLTHVLLHSPIAKPDYSIWEPGWKVYWGPLASVIYVSMLLFMSIRISCRIIPAI